MRKMIPITVMISAGLSERQVRALLVAQIDGPQHQRPLSSTGGPAGLRRDETRPDAPDMLLREER